MEFRTREIKMPKQFQQRTTGSNKKPPIEDKPKLFVVFIKCEIFEISELNKIDVLAPIPSTNRSYDQNTRIREYIYEVESNARLSRVAAFWKQKAPKDLVERIQFTIRPIPKSGEEK